MSGSVRDVPWCEDCTRYLTPNSVNDDGTCPTCGETIQLPEGEEPNDDNDEKAPWHFKLMIVALVVYLGWRFVQLVT